MNIRVMTKSDIPIIYNFWKKVGLDVAGFEREKKEIEMCIKLNSDSCLLLKKDGKLIGTVIGTFNGRRAWIYHLAIHPKWQREKYGSLLYEKVEELLKKKGATKIILGISLKSPKVFNFYKRYGYKVIENAIMVEKDLY